MDPQKRKRVIIGDQEDLLTYLGSLMTLSV